MKLFTEQQRILLIYFSFLSKINLRRKNLAMHFFASGLLVVVVVVGLTAGLDDMVNKLFEPVFVPWDYEWRDRECLMTL